MSSNGGGDEDKARKTHKPTSKRLSEARKQGQCARSKDLVSTGTMIIAGLAFFALSERLFGSIADMVRAAASTSELDQMGSLAGETLLYSCVPFLVVAFFGCWLTIFMQLGWPPAIKFPTPDLSKIIKLEGLKNILSLKQAAGRIIKDSAKVFFVGAAIILAIKQEFDEFFAHPAIEPASLSVQIGDAMIRLSIYASVVLLIISIVDFIYQKHDFMSQMMMTTEELKREHKEQEGDPLFKSRRRQKAAEISQHRISTEVQQADVVLVNPTHYAVALRYDPNKDGAPKVVAKGKDRIAEYIRKVARNAGVPIISRPPLTRFLFKIVKEGHEIPSNVYHAIAEILAYVYRLRTRTS